MQVDFWDRYSRGDTYCHRWPTPVKLSLAILVTCLGLLVPAEHWPVHGVLMCVVFAALSVAQIPMRYLWHRWAGFIPVLLALTISIPAANGFRAGWDLVAEIMLRSLLTFTVGLWLVNVTPFDTLLRGLSRCGVPRVFIAILAFMYRYSYVVFDELQRMQTARRARQFGHASRWREFVTTTQILAMLLIRSLSRAERVYGAMCARGWRGEVQVLDQPRK